jgi:hypothetical protein
MSATHGRLGHTKGKEAKSKQYTGGTLFVDHATQYVHCTHQVSLRVGETLKAKNSFEGWAKESGHKISHYHADNAPFRSAEFVHDCTIKGQTMSYSGVGAHHQNGVAERSIQTITSWARAMMLHSIIHWPGEARLELWPMAMDQAIYLWNNSPKRGSRMAPTEVFTGMKFENFNHLQRAHVWGCPVYVLDPMLQDGKKVPKWRPRARRGLYVGVSQRHSTTVGRVLNLNTGHISAQYHCVYDDTFSTVSCPFGNPFDVDTFSEETWQRIIETGYERHVPIEFDARGRPLPLFELADDWLSGPERLLRSRIRRERTERRMQHLRNDPETQAQREPRVPNNQETQAQREPRVQREPRAPIDPDAAPPPLLPGRAALRRRRARPTRVERDRSEGDPSSSGSDGEDTSSDVDSSDDDSDTEFYRQRSGRKVPIGDADGFKRTKSGRRVIPPDVLGANPSYRDIGFPGENMSSYGCGRNPKQKVRSSKLNQAYTNSLDWDRAVNMLKGGTLGAMWAELEQHTNQESGTVEWMNPALFSVKANAEDNPTWHEAMGGPNAEGYWQACKKEYETLISMKVWEVVERQTWMNVIPSTWAFKCKRYPDGLVRKLKSRFCARGDRQIEGVDYFETYAPVVNWQTVRIMLVMSLLLGLETKQVDYTAAFVHADIDRDPNWDSMSALEREQSGVYIQMPKGFQTAGRVLKLKKSLYGLKQSPRNFFLHLKEKLELVGFVQSEHDQCLFVSDKVICLVYVDDTLLYGPNMEDIDECIQALTDAGMNLEIEDDVAGFLGVHIDRRNDGTIHMTQVGLTDRIIIALNIGDMHAKRTPAEFGCLGKDEWGDPPQGSYNYASVIGMLQYLQGHSRPDIAFAVAQCSRYTHSPRYSHEIALQRIGLYLKGTKNRGLIFNPDKSKEVNIDCYVDADFAGMWGYEDEQDPSCVKSRTGFVIFIQGCPVVWKSKLQTDVATSTMESEYNALSMSMRDVLPLKDLTKAIVISLGLEGIGLIDFKATIRDKTHKTTTFNTTLHEDNDGCMRLAKMEPGRMTPRSKHYGVKYHWFRTKLKPNEIEIDRVDTSLQKADFLTKALRTKVFETNRKLTCGW